MPAGLPGKEQFRRAIPEFRNLHIVAALGPLLDFRSEVVSNDEFGVRGGLDDTTKGITTSRTCWRAIGCAGAYHLQSRENAARRSY